MIIVVLMIELAKVSPWIYFKNANLSEKSGSLWKKSHIKDREILSFSDTEIEKLKLHCYKNPIFLKDVNIDIKILSEKVSFHKWILI